MSAHATAPRTTTGTNATASVQADSRAPRDSPVHLHIGASALAQPLLANIASQLPGVTEVIVDGDSWADWYSPSKPEDAKHIVVQVEDQQAATIVAGVLEGSRMLHRTTDEHQVAWVMTDPSDWGQVITTDHDTATHPHDRKVGANLRDAYVQRIARTAHREMHHR